MRTASVLTRAICGTLFAMMLVLRLLTPAGFMPAFDHGAVTIVACPDADAAVVSVMNHHHHNHHPVDHSIGHQPCPYAASSALGALGSDWGPQLLLATLLAAALSLGRAFLFVDQRRHERPHAIGPPAAV